MNFKTYTFLFFACAFLFYYGFYRKQNTGPAIKNSIVIGTSADYPPYAFIDLKTNSVVGFDVDVAREVAQRMGKEYKIKDVPFQSLIFGLLAEDIDIIAAGISPTPRRAKAVTFSDSYLEGDPLVVLYNKNKKVGSLEELKKLSIVVNTGYTADLFLSKISGMEFMRLDAPPEALMALATNIVDAFVCAQSSLNNMGTKKDLSEFNRFIIPETGDPYALATSKHRTEFVQKINKAISSMKKDGTLKALQKKWDLV